MGPTICGGVNKRVELNARNRDEIVNSISPTDKWANQEDEPETGAVFKIVCRALAEGLARMVGISRICGE